MLAIRLILVVTLFVGCSDMNGSACEAARSTVIKAMEEICGKPGTNGRINGGEKGYAESKFCRRCVDAQFYSTTGGSACQCMHLTFDAPSCSYETEDDAKAQVRSAIDWADGVCADFTPPAAIPPAINDDAGKSKTADGSTP